MLIDSSHASQLLKALDIPMLFTRDLGWDHHSTVLEVQTGGQLYRLAGVVERRSVEAFTYLLNVKNFYSLTSQIQILCYNYQHSCRILTLRLTIMAAAIRAVDLFCGGGGSTFGASSAGVKVVAGIDSSVTAAKAYASNFPSTKLYNNDIRKLSPKEIRGEIGDVDLIIASPECTNHSVAKGRHTPDEESRMTAFEVTRFAAEFMPQWIIIENVVQMQSWSKHDKILDTLWGLGYFVRQVKINAQDLGVPQSRTRLFLLCSRSIDVKFQLPTPKAIVPASSIIDAVNTNYKQRPLRVDGRAKATLMRADRAIAALGDKEPFLIVYYGSDGSGGWQPLTRPLRTITTLDRFAYVAPNENGHLMRMLQPEELKLAMGFTDDYAINIPGINRRQKIQILGNGVCPPVMRYIIQTITESRHFKEGARK